MSVAAAIIGGGKATRMGGRPKHLLVVEGRRIVDRQIDVLRLTFGTVFAVANDATLWADTGLRVYPDRFPGGAGPLAGIDAALAALPADATSVVCVACDMPYLDPRILELIRDREPEADVVMPGVGGRPEPLFARYGRACADAVRAQLDSGDFKVTRFLERVRVAWLEEEELRAIDPTLRFLSNVNTPSDLAAPDAKV